jgi:hydrogenase expression/formation protein HypC
MCVGLAAKVIKVQGKVAVVDAGGARKTISSELLTDLDPGDYVMVHAGSAIAKITDTDEDETDNLLENL